MALGADNRAVTRMVVFEGLAPVFVGVLLGMTGSAGLSRALAAYLWGVTPTDMVTYLTVAALLMGVALMASWVPAREAVGLDAADTLTCD